MIEVGSRTLKLYQRKGDLLRERTIAERKRSCLLGWALLFFSLLFSPSRTGCCYSCGLLLLLGSGVSVGRVVYRQ